MLNQPSAFWRHWGCAAVLSLATVAAFSAMGSARAETVRASFYGAESGARTASGERFNPMGLTFAHPTMAFHTRARVCFRQCAICTANDRGPFVQGRGADLSRGCARAVGLERVGVGMVDISILGSSLPRAAHRSVRRARHRA